MSRLEIVRYATLVVPLLALWAAVRLLPGVGTRRDGADRREAGALLLAGIAAAVGLAVLHEVATAAGWWRFTPVAGSFRGLPVDLWIGWAVLWGPLPVALRDRVGLPTALVAAAFLDVVAMPAMAPLVVLGPGWLWGEAAGLAGVLVPAVLLGTWTARDVRLHARATLQLVVAGATMLWLLPTAVFELADGSWAAVLDRPWWQLAVLLQLAAVLALPALAAAQELAVVGGGTPYPWDPTRRLVTSGPYAHLANPMQLSAVGLLVLLAVTAGSAALAVAALGGVAFAATVAAPHEDEHLRARFGDAYARYRREVGAWRPRWRPYRDTAAADAGAVLWLAAGCPTCRGVGDALVGLRPTGLTLAAAEAFPRRGHGLARARYERASHDADQLAAGADQLAAGADGLAAIGRALEHVHLGVAWIGWLVRLPVVAPVLQAVADVVAPMAGDPAPPTRTRIAR